MKQWVKVIAFISALGIIVILFFCTQPQTDNYIHISFDDTFEIFKDLTINERLYDSIFDNDTLSFMLKLHNDFDAVFSMYCFYEYGEYDLSQFTDAFSKEFSENSDWLRFGFHSYNPNSDFSETDYKTAKKCYDETTTQLKRIVGEDAIDNTLRLHLFAGNSESISAVNFEVDALFTADDDRKSYDLMESDNKYISNNDHLYLSKKDIHYISTDLRLENTNNPYGELSEIKSDIQQNKFIEVFTHEWQMGMIMKIKLFSTCFWAKQNGYRWMFPDEVFNY